MPAGLRFAQADPEGGIVNVPASSTDDEETRAQLLADIEREDGDSTLPLFTQGKRVKRVSTSPRRASTSSLDDEEADFSEDDETSANAMAKFYKTPSSKGVDSKLVYLSDVLPPIPSKGDFDLEKIRQSLYFFS